MIILAAQTLGSFSKPDPRDLSRRRAFHFSLGFKVSDTEDMLDIVLCRTDHKKVENLRHDFKQDRMYALMNNAYSQASHSQAHHIAGEIHKVHILLWKTLIILVSIAGGIISSQVKPFF